MITLAHGIAARGVHVDIVVAEREGPYKDTLDRVLRVIDLDAPRVLFCIPRLIKYLRRERPDALLSTLDYANVAAVCAHHLAHVPTKVAVLEQNTISVSSMHSPQWRQRLMPSLVGWAYPWADHVIGNSQGVAEDLVHITGLPSERIHVIYNPVVTTEILRRSRATPDHAWLRPGGVSIILAAGRLTPQKDFTTLICAFAQVLKQRPARLMILGEGPERAQLESLVSRLNLQGHVALPGFVSNPHAYMARAAAFVLSSRWEGLPTVLIEALSCGTRVVATDCPSGPREILSDGKYGTLVPVQDVSTLAAALVEALDGQTSMPSADSWRPYEVNCVIDQYMHLLFDMD